MNPPRTSSNLSVSSDKLVKSIQPAEYNLRGDTLIMVIALLRGWLNQLGEVQQHSVNHSRQDISASVVEEANGAGSAGWGGGQGRKEKKITGQRPTLNRINGLRGWEREC